MDGASVPASLSKNGFLEITRKWTSSHVKVAFTKRVTQEPLPGDSQRFALLDGPVVLAALANTEPEILAKDAITPQNEHQYLDGRDWQSGHFLVRTRQGGLPVVPLYEVTDEAYSIYFTAQR